MDQARRMTVVIFCSTISDIQVPMIAAANGPALIHAELAVLCDIVLASEQAEFQDAPHFLVGWFPVTAFIFVWPLLLGPATAGATFS